MESNMFMDVFPDKRKIKDVYPKYYIKPCQHIKVGEYGQYLIKETGSIEIAGTLEFDTAGMLIIDY